MELVSPSLSDVICLLRTLLNIVNIWQVPAGTQLENMHLPQVRVNIDIGASIAENKHDN